MKEKRIRKEEDQEAMMTKIKRETRKRRMKRKIHKSREIKALRNQVIFIHQHLHPRGKKNQCKLLMDIKSIKRGRN
jgi:hypothetical protein